MWKIAKTVSVIILTLASIALLAGAVYLYGYATGSSNEYRRNQQFKNFQPEKVLHTGDLLDISGFQIRKLEKVCQPSTSKHLGIT